MRRRYNTAPDQLGLALAVGAGATALGSAAIAAMRMPLAWWPLALLIAWPLAAASICLLFGPAWALLHRIGWRSPTAAGALGAVLTGALWCLLLRDRWPGIDLAPRLLLLGATGMLPTLIGAAIALMMWRIAYRRSGDVLELRRPPR